MNKKEREIVIPTEEEVGQYAPDAARDSGGPESGETSPGPGKSTASAREGGSQDAPAPEADTSAAPGEETAPAENDDETIESVRARVEDYKDKLLRAQAECANVGKRLRQQHSASLKLAGSGLARDLLPVVDSFERTMASLEQAAQGDPILEGVKLIAEQLQKTLNDHGVVPISVVGTQFDPTRHEAMMQDRDTDEPTGTVTRELQRGYMMNDRVLRPAKVAVAGDKEERGKQEAPPPDEDQNLDGSSKGSA